MYLSFISHLKLPTLVAAYLAFGGGRRKVEKEQKITPRHLSCVMCDVKKIRLKRKDERRSGKEVDFYDVTHDTLGFLKGFNKEYKICTNSFRDLYLQTSLYFRIYLIPLPVITRVIVIIFIFPRFLKYMFLFPFCCTGYTQGSFGSLN